MVQFEDLAGAISREDHEFVLEHADAVLIQGDCPPEKVGWVFLYKCAAALGTGQLVLAIASGEQALTWATQQKESALERQARLCLGYAMLRTGRVSEAVGLLEGYLAGMANHPAWQKQEGLARFNLGVAYRHSGRLHEAVAEYRKALALPEDSPGLHVQIRQNLAWALLLLHDAVGAREQLDAVAEHVRETLSLSRHISLWVDRAALCVLEGDLSRARDACQQVLQALDEKERAVHLATTYVTLGRIALAEGDREEAQRCSMLARAHAEKAERWDLHNEGTRLWVAASEKGGRMSAEAAMAGSVRLLVVGRRDQ